MPTVNSDSSAIDARSKEQDLTFGNAIDRIFTLEKKYENIEATVIEDWLRDVAATILHFFILCKNFYLQIHVTKKEYFC